MTQAVPVGGNAPDPIREGWDSLLDSVSHDPESVESAYDRLRSGAPATMVRTIECAFKETIAAAKTGRMIRDGASALPSLAAGFHKGRKVDRTLLVRSATSQLVAMGMAAAAENAGERKTLDELGREFATFVLRGTPQQLFTAELSIYLGLAPVIPEQLGRLLVVPLVGALSTLVEVGAPATRDAVMEGLGALLKHLPKDAPPFTLPKLTAAQRDYDGSRAINRSYETRRHRREWIARAIAGEPESRQRFFDALSCPLGSGYERRTDLVRALPALWRQTAFAERDAMRDTAFDFLLEAAAIIEPEPNASTEVQTAFARYQERVFRTLSVMLDRQVDAAPSDLVVARAVRHIPRTLVGSLELCNAQVRATVAILRTATRVAARLQDSATDRALQPLFEQLGTGFTDWTNPGIVEGCFRGLPPLLWDREHDWWTRGALETLFAQLKRKSDLTDLAVTHLRLSAHASFRRVLIALTERVHRQSLAFHTAEEAAQRASAAERTIRSLLADPSADSVLAIFATGTVPSDDSELAMPRTFSEHIVNATALDTELLHRTASLFDDWPRMSAARRLLLIRILGMQLRCASQDTVKIGRVDILRNVFSGLAEVTVDAGTRDEKLWQLLSDIPSSAAEGADADLQDFVQYRSGDASAKDASASNDLPGHVLSMVSDDVSYRLASAIARQVDLNRRRAMLEREPFDFATAIYQVMLRGPNIAIFDHLLARVVEPKHRSLLKLFREHVEAVRDCKPKHGEEIDIRKLVKHALALIPKLKKHEKESRVLRDLATAMKWYIALASERPDVWDSLVGSSRRKELFLGDDGEAGGLGALLRILDGLANEKVVEKAKDPRRGGKDAADRESSPHKRPALARICLDEAVHLRLAVEYYLRLPVGKFEAAAEAMRDAIAAVQQIEAKIVAHRGLQPPEQTILLALLHRWRDMFERTIACWIDAPRRCVEGRQPEAFWKYFVRDPDAKRTPSGPWLEAALLLERGHLGEAIRRRLYGPAKEIEPPIPTEPLPPIPTGQDLAFEQFYVEWMSSELDVDNLHAALYKRWKLFRLGYAAITRLSIVLFLIALPCVVAAQLRAVGHRELEAVVFFAYVVLIGMLASVALLGRIWQYMFTGVRQWIRKLRQRTEPRPRRKRYPYRFQSLLPRLFRLIVVPLAVVVDFEHSYLFPMHASNTSLVILMALAFLSTTFFVRRELRTRTTELSRMDDHEPPPADVRRRVRQIVSIALAQAFAVALIFSSVFESNYIVHLRTADQAHAAAVGEKDATEGEDDHLFLGVLPRDARFELAAVLPSAWHFEHIEEMTFDFYPTLILSWTALGLFFGVFLEGFFEGKRLRGDVAHH